jgi:hypothetical protein
VNKFNEVMYVVQDALKYSIFEVCYLFLVIIDGWGGDPISDVTLAIGAVLAVVWVIASSTAEAQDEAREMVRERELFVTDFWMSAFVLTLIAIVIRNADWFYVAIIALAIGQNLRYSYLTIQWVREQQRGER